MEECYFKIIRKEIVSAPQSLLTIPAGETVFVSCRDFAPISTVKSAISRLNQKAGRIEFIVTSPDNGATLQITRHE